MSKHRLVPSLACMVLNTLIYADYPDFAKIPWEDRSKDITNDILTSLADKKIPQGIIDSANWHMKNMMVCASCGWLMVDYPAALVCTRAACGGLLCGHCVRNENVYRCELCNSPFCRECEDDLYTTTCGICERVIVLDCCDSFVYSSRGGRWRGKHFPPRMDKCCGCA